MAKPASEVFRLYKTDGVPSSGAHPISKQDQLDWAAEKDQQVDDLLSGQQSLLSDAVRKTGANELAGTYTFTNPPVLPAPTAANHAARKQDIEVASTGYQTKNAVDAVIASALSSYTYANGTAGVGATLTANANGAFGTIDGVSAGVGKRYLFLAGTSAAHNGVYTLTTVGGAGSAWVLTRATDADTAAELARMRVRSLGGTTYAGRSYVLNLLQSDITVGSTELNFVVEGDFAGLAPLSSPAFTDTPTAPTPTAEDDSTKLATTAFVRNPANIRLETQQHTPDPFPTIKIKPRKYWSAATRKLDAWLTYAGASDGSYYDADGHVAVAGSGVPRFSADPDNYGLTGLKIEPACTNLVTYSEEMHRSGYTKSNVTVTTDDGVAPDGTTSAELCVVDAASGAHTVYRNATGLVSGEAYCSSWHIKPTGIYTKYRLQCGDTGGSNYARVEFDTDTGLFGDVTLAGTATGARVYKEYVRSHGYWRLGLSVEGVAETTLRSTLSVLDEDGTASFTGDGTSGFHLWGFQIEDGHSMTSYIKTVASTVTRAVGTTTFTPDFLSAAAGVIYWRGRVRPSSSIQTLWSIDDNSGNNSLLMRLAANNRFAVIGSVGGVNQTTVTGPQAVNDPVDIAVAFAYGPDGYRLAVTGQAIGRAAGSAAPTGLTHGRIGTARVVANNPSVADHYEFAVFPGYMSDSDLQVLVGNTQGSTTPVTVEQRSEFPTIKAWTHLLTYGQSLSRGGNSAPALSTSQLYNALTFAGGVRATSSLTTSKALVEEDDGELGETPCTQAARTFSELLALSTGLTTSDIQVFASAGGASGREIARLGEGGSHSGTMLAQVQAAVALAQAASKDYACSVVYWVQGEADASLATPTETYRQELKDLRAWLEATVNGHTGRNDPLYLLVQQTSARVRTYDGIALAQFRASRDDRRIIILGPTNQFPEAGDGLHWSNAGSRHAGAYYGKAAAAIYGGRRPSVVEPISATAVGTSLRVKVVADYNIALDTGTFCFPTTDHGFKVIDGTGTLTLSSIAVENSADGRFVTMTLNRALGSNPKIRYALDYSGTGLTMGNSASGTLRDSDPTTVAIAGTLTQLPNLCPHFELPIQVISEF